MNHFDNEENIINILHILPLCHIRFINPSWEAIKYFFSLRNKKKYINWVNSSGKDALPPDFFSDRYGYMAEVMRTDDYILGKDSPNARESQVIKHIDDMRRENGMPTFKESNTDVFILQDMTKVSKNGYPIYIENFRRIIQKHVEKIENYRRNHPGYKLGFIIYDEAPAYMRILDKDVVPKPGGRVKGYFHLPHKDKRLVECFMEADVDFVIWMTPYKHMPGNPKITPLISVFDMKKKGSWRKRLKEYNIDEIICLEVEKSD